MKATIYGASDDLVEVEGDINEEFNTDNVTLIFGDGTHVRVRYCSDALWRLSVEKTGTAKVVSAFVATDPDSKDYSDKLTLEGDLVCVDAYQTEEARMGEHTPGPWRWFENASGGCRVQTQGVGIADVLSRAGVPHPVQESCAANARLIAAAPDLLEALEQVEQRAREAGECPLCHQPPEVGCAPACPLTAARAAIAKARWTR